MSGPSGLRGFGKATRMPLPNASRAMCCSKILQMTSASLRDSDRVPVAYRSVAMYTFRTQCMAVLQQFNCSFHFSCCNWLVQWLTRAHKGGKWDHSRVSEPLYKPHTDGVCFCFVSCNEFAFWVLYTQRWLSWCGFHCFHSPEHLAEVIT